MTESKRPDRTCLAMLRVKPFTVWKGECDAARKDLVVQGEHVPAPFMHASFGDGMAHFFPRIYDGSKSLIGMPSRPGPWYTSQIQIARK